MSNKSLERMIFKTVDIPALPSVVAKSLSLLSKNDVSIQELEEAVAADQAFTARLLRVANSPFYGMSRGVDTISGAIKLVGFSAVKSIILSVSFKDLHRKQNEIDQMLWGHSIAVAGASVVIAQHKKLHLNDELFVAGLIHDIGKTIINHSDAGVYKEVLTLIKRDGMTFPQAEKEILGFDHCNVGGYIARKWKLPKILEDVIESHHLESEHWEQQIKKLNQTASTHPEQDVNNIKDPQTRLVCDIIKAADAICWEMGIGVEKPIDFKIQISDFLQLEPEEMAMLKKNIISEYEKQKTLFNQDSMI
ncbi:MAG: HDOD domain-containing protein [Nitrospirae bacterium]|nr:HDOD domain-containing protein [Nitrospirota bacterium]MBF0541735.1 HDOD domain-containing protein [Nitrospirota bacterium]